MTKKKPAPAPRIEVVRRPLDTRSLLERAAQDDELLAANYVLTDQQQLQCLRCDHVTRQPLNARNHLAIRHPEIFEAPANEEQAKEN